MIDLGISKLALIGVVALVVIGPEKLPKVARTVGALFGKAQRYVSDVKAEVNRSIELEELKKMKDQMTSAAQNFEQSVQTAARDIESDFEQAAREALYPEEFPHLNAPTYKRPDKNWRLKRGAVPQWYKVKSGRRTHVQSGAARVARFRPRPNRISL